MAWVVENIAWYPKPWPAHAYYIGRGGKGLAQSIFANPFVYEWVRSNNAHVTPVKDPIAAFRKHLWHDIQTQGSMYQELMNLLPCESVLFLCFCKSKTKVVPCHGDVLVNASIYLRSRC